jgi:cobalt/nickel transport system permease protein
MSLVATAAARQAGIVGSLDPRARILAALAFAAVVVSLGRWEVLVLALGVSVATMVAARMPAGPTLKRMAMMDGFIVFMLVMLPFTIPGDPAFAVFGFPASWQGLERAVIIGLKANAVILCLLALVGSMEPTTLGHALSRLRLPENLIHLMLFTVRYIDVIHDEYRRLRTAMKMRGFRPANSWHTYRSFGYLIGMLLVRALERSERILRAMKCRGFTGRLIVLDNLRYGRRDGGFAVLWLSLLVALVFLEMAHVPLF